MFLLFSSRVRPQPSVRSCPCAPDGPDQTTVELEHRLLERLVDGQALRDGINSGGGWTAMLELFAKAAANQE
jgi:hypothetical protein